MSTQLWGDWWRERRALAVARRWMRHGDADRIAADALWRLNRHARWCKAAGADGVQIHAIYAVKDLLLRAFWMRGFGRAVTMQNQVLVCYGCGGTGQDGPPWEQWTCLRCGGTGVYRRVPVLRFRFEIAGRRYVWHAPERQCGWFDTMVTPLDDQADFRTPRPLGTDRLTPEHVAVLLGACRVWLREDAAMLLRPGDAELGLTPLRWVLRNEWWRIGGWVCHQWRTVMVMRRRRETGEIPF